MPELPDVEMYKQYLDVTALQQPIAHIHIESMILLKDTSTQGLGKALKHQCFQSTRRHGKYLFVALNPFAWLVMHFGMTGDLKYFQHEQDTSKYAQLIITFENGFHLAYISRRKLGLITLIETPQQFIAAHHLGPDALAFTLTQFYELAAKRRKNVKAWLMDQQIIAGIGNIYSDEILFQAKIQPEQNIKDLNGIVLKDLYHTMVTVLKSAIQASADPRQMPSYFLLPHRKQGGRCPKCAHLIKKIKVAGRSAWYCLQCQQA